VWTLVFIIFIGNELKTQAMDSYDSMYDCFKARDILSSATGGKDGYFPPGSQAICVYRDEVKL